METLLFSGIVPAVVAVLISAIFSWYIPIKINQKQKKIDLLTRILGFRRQPLPPEFFVALNELMVTFCGNKKIETCIKTMLNEGSGPDNINLTNLIRCIAKESDIDISNFSDDELTRSFTLNLK